MRRRNRELKETKVEIIPMIDTMFFLLVFFILSSVGVIKLQGININLPKAEPAAPQKPTAKPLELTITITGNESVFVNKTPVPAGASVAPILESEVKRQKGAAAKMEDVTVLVSANGKARYDVMVRCIDEARDAGIFKFAIVPTDDPEPAPAPN